MKGLIIYAPGNLTKDVAPKLALGQMYKELSCELVERIVFPWGEMWVDEMFAIRTDKPPIANVVATRLLVRSFPWRTTIILGDVYVRYRDDRFIFNKDSMVSKRELKNLET